MKKRSSISLALHAVFISWQAMADGPDMIAQGLTGNANVFSRHTITITGIADNYGHGASGATTMKLKRSGDAQITPHDLTVDSVSVPSINGRADIEPQLQSSIETEFRRSLSTRALPNEGIYHYGVCVDAVDGETNTSNNCSNAIAISVTKAHTRLPQGKTPNFRDLEQVREPMRDPGRYPVSPRPPPKSLTDKKPMPGKASKP